MTENNEHAGRGEDGQTNFTRSVRGCMWSRVEDDLCLAVDDDTSRPPEGTSDPLYTNRGGVGSRQTVPRALAP